MGSPGLGVQLRRPPLRLRRLAPARAESQSSKAQPERSKKELLFPTLERAALRSLRETWDSSSLAAGDLGLEEGGEGGDAEEAPPLVPPPSSSSFFQPPSLPSAPLPRQLAPP